MKRLTFMFCIAVLLALCSIPAFAFAEDKSHLGDSGISTALSIEAPATVNGEAIAVQPIFGPDGSGAPALTGAPASCAIHDTAAVSAALEVGGSPGASTGHVHDASCGCLTMK